MRAESSGGSPIGSAGIPIAQPLSIQRFVDHSGDVTRDGFPP